MIDSDQRPDWSCTYGPCRVVSDIGDLEEMMQVVGHMSSSAEAAPELRDPQMVFGGPLAPVQAIIDFLTDFRSAVPVLRVGDEYRIQLQERHEVHLSATWARCRFAWTTRSSMVSASCSSSSLSWASARKASQLDELQAEALESTSLPVQRPSGTPTSNAVQKCW